MSQSPSDAYALLESSFSASPNLRSHKPLPHRSDYSRNHEPAAAPLQTGTLWRDDDTESQSSSQLSTPLASPAAVSGTESGLPPTPPSHDGLPATDLTPPPHADGVVASLASRKSTLSTPINQRSPPTPDPSPPRKTTAASSMSTPERPAPHTYPSSRAESFTTAREEPLSSGAEESRSTTPVGARLSVVEEHCGPALAFEREDHDTTPRNTMIEPASQNEAKTGESESGLGGKHALDVGDIPFREWDTNLMRNVTVRKRRNMKPSPQKRPDLPRPASPAASPVAASTPRRSSSLRERIEASGRSPHTPSIENFAKAIGWPTDAAEPVREQASDPEGKRFSTTSMSSTVVEAMVVVTPPQRRRTLRHSGKNLAYLRDTDSPIGSSTTAYSSASMRSEDVPLHRLVHKRAVIADGRKRISSDSAAMSDRTASPASLLRRAQDSAAVTLAHQQSIRNVLQPAAEMMSRSNSVTRNAPSRSFHKRIASAPEAAARTHTPSVPNSDFEVSPPGTPSPQRTRKPPSKLARVQAASPSSHGDHRHLLLPRLLDGASPSGKSPLPKDTPNFNKSLPEIPLDLPTKSTSGLDKDDHEVYDSAAQETRPPSAMLERVRHLLAAHEAAHPITADLPQAEESSKLQASLKDAESAVRPASVSSHGRSEEKRKSPVTQERPSTSRDAPLRSSLDGVHTEEHPRSSHEWPSLRTDANGRVSFDRSTAKTDEHAMARHLFSQTTPFSQFSDTPIEVSEATAISIYPHNNNSLLVVQQVARTNLQPQESCQIANGAHFATSGVEELGESSETFFDADEGPKIELPRPTLTFEPSTPPMQISLPAHGAVDSPLKNPRPPPAPPVVIIPPTPAEELEKQLVPGPPKRSDSHPQRRLTLKQRARRYSDNFISPFLARASSMRGRSASSSHAGHGQSQIPTVSDENGSLHPFWRPRGFWDDFEDSDSDSVDSTLPRGGDTSDVGDEDLSPRKRGTLGRRLTNGFKGPGNFLIGNSLGVERSGTNRRKPRTEPPARHRTAPKVLIQPPTFLFRSTLSSRVRKRPSQASVRSSSTRERPRRRAETWRQGKKIPGFKGVQVQYIGLSGVKERFQERRAERRRNLLRKSIGKRFYVEPVPHREEDGGRI